MKITIKLHRFTVTLIKSPLYFVVSALFGISMSFCLLGLYWFGQNGVPMSNPWVLLSIAIIWFVQLYFFVIASPLIRQVRKSSAVDPSAAKKASS